MPAKLLLFLLLLLAALVRIDFLQAVNARLDSDEAIVGLMAKHILEGKGIPTFYYGQHYMGSFEALIAALGFSIFGVSAWVLQAVPLVFSIIFLWLLYLLACEVASKRAALFTVLLGALPPATLIIWSTKARGGFIEVMCIGVAALLTTVHWLKNTEKRADFAVYTGLLLGFGWWVNNQIIYFMLPIALIGVLSWIGEKLAFKSVLRYAFYGLISFFVGGAPYWLYNIERGFPSLGMFRFASVSEIFQSLAGVFHTAVPILLGGKRFWHSQELLPGSSWLVWLLILICLLTVWQSRKQQIKEFACSQIDCKRPFELIIVFLIATFFVFCVSSFGYLVQAPRYLLPAYTGILLLAGFAIDQQLIRKNRILASFILLGFLSLSWASSFLGGRAIPGEPFIYKQQRASKDHTELIAWLTENKYQWVRTNYWIGYRLAFETQEQVKFLVFSEPHETRIVEYQKQGLKFGRQNMPLVLVPAQAEYVETALVAQGYLYKKISLSGYMVIFDITPSQSDLKKIDRNSFQVTASDRLEYAELAVDGDIETRWRSAKPQEHGMSFEIQFKNPTRLRALKYETAAWAHDYPRGLSITLKYADGSTEELYEAVDYEAIRYYLHGDTTLSFYMDKQAVKSIQLVQTNQHSLFDWSIAELGVYE